MGSPSNPLGSTGSGVLQQLQQLLQNSQAQQAPVTQAQDQFQQQGQNQLGQQMAQGQPATPQGLPPQGPAPQADYSGGIGGRVKNTLSNFFYGMGQGMLKEAGLPTDYQKQQDAIKNQHTQQQLDQSKQEIGSLIQLHQGQLQQEQFEQAPVNLPAPIAQMLGVPSVARKDFPGAISAYGAIAQNQPSVTLPAGLEHLGFTAGQAVSPRQLANATKVSSMLNAGWKQGQAGGVDFFYNPANGQKIVMGPDDRLAAAGISAAARAQNTPFQTFDDQGNLVTTNAANAIKTGAPSATAYNTLYGPTGTTKSQGQAAATVAQHIPDYKALVDKLGADGKLGPVLGRLNTYLTQGYGGDDPDISKFVTETSLIKSGAVRAHFGARGGSQVLSKFDNILNTAQTPAAIKASVDEIGNFLNTYGTNAKLQGPKTNLKGGAPAPQQPAGQTGSYWEQFPVRNKP